MSGNELATFASSLAIGLLIGFERERSHRNGAHQAADKAKALAADAAEATKSAAASAAESVSVAADKAKTLADDALEAGKNAAVSAGSSIKQASENVASSLKGPADKG